MQLTFLIESLEVGFVYVGGMVARCCEEISFSLGEA